jgi:6-pyruvoyltetrahydropterin/6-carboxytetrahydropterin synthase
VDTARRVAGFVREQLIMDPDAPFAALARDVQVADTWPDASSPAWRSVAWPLRFHAAHCLERLPDGQKCRRQHGHGYQIGVELDPAAGGSPTTSQQPAEAFVRRHLHQRSLNEVLGNPTAERLAEFLGARFTGELDIPGIVRVVVAETPTTTAEWRPAESGS